MAFARLTEEQNAEHWRRNFTALLEAVRARYVEKDEIKAQVAALKGAAAVAAWDAAKTGSRDDLPGG